jgi:hypothetical protein
MASRSFWGGMLGVAVQGERLARYGQSEQRDPKSRTPSSHQHEVASNRRGEALVVQSRSVF